MSHQPPDNSAFDAPLNAAELADLYAAGALTREETAAFERRVASGDPEYVAELARVKPVLEALLGSAPEVAPPARLRAAMAHDLGAGAGGDEQIESPFRPHDEHGPEGELTPAGAGAAGSGILIARLGQGRWHPTGLRGVRFRQLHADVKSNRRTILLQMDPGTALPDHEHTGAEEIIMLSGDLTLAGATLGPGDYIRIAADARHGVPRTAGGCTCIIVSGYQPFPVKSWWGFIKAAVRGWFRR